LTALAEASEREAEKVQRAAEEAAATAEQHRRDADAAEAELSELDG
jgi:hypothetical protein